MGGGDYFWGVTVSATLFETLKAYADKKDVKDTDIFVKKLVRTFYEAAQAAKATYKAAEDDNEISNKLYKLKNKRYEFTPEIAEKFVSNKTALKVLCEFYVRNTSNSLSYCK